MHGMLAASRGQSTVEQLRELFRLAHTLKGAARVVGLVEIGDIAHEIEDALAPVRDGGSELPGATAQMLLARLDAIGGLLQGVDATDARAPAEPSGPLANEVPGPDVDAFKSVRVPMVELDGLLEGVLEARAMSRIVADVRSELVLAARTAHALSAQLGPVVASAVGRSVRGDAERLDQHLSTLSAMLQEAGEGLRGELGALHESMARLRLVPIGELVVELERAAHDAANTLGRQVVFEHTGASIGVDADVLAVLRGALRHVVVNAVAHGIEDPPARARAGKAPAGVIRVETRRRVQHVVIACSDDGRGFDIEAIRARAIERGVLKSERARDATLDELVDLLLQGGVSTAVALTAVAGRGVGLDAVRHALEALNGQLRVETEPSRGSTVELTVPVTLSAVPALALEAAGRTSFLPLDSVRQALAIAATEIAHTEQGDQVVVQGRALSLLRLAEALGSSSPTRPTRGTMTVVVVESGHGRFALAVDAVHGVQTVVVRPLPSHVQADHVVGGAALGDDGRVQLVLAPAALTQLALRGSARAPARSEPVALPLLVVDDSLTTRMLEQSILESAGYRVDVASSGEEGLERARKRRYGAFIVDVEMPGISGFEFVAATRRDPELREIPSILVTSLASTEDKRRGKDAGARAYIVKSEFDQKVLLDTIAKLVGST